MERGDWAAAMVEVGHDIPWYERRVNLLVDGLDLPQSPGATIRIGDEVVLLVTRECDPCHRMETLAEGLKAALDAGLARRRMHAGIGRRPDRRR